jgi:SagB-type dehydrogenase family enzyme
MLNYQISQLEEYNEVSKNQIGYKFQKTGHLVHYSDYVVNLQSTEYIKANGEITPLPHCSFPNPELSLVDAFYNRKSERKFNTINTISINELALLLHFSVGYKGKENIQKFTPTSGGLNSVEAYVFILSSNELKKGVYKYNPYNHELITINEGDFSQWLKEDVFYQEEYGDGSCVIVLTSSCGKLFKKYGQRSYRLSLLDVGHVSQNLYLIASALNKQVCASAGFIDDELNDALMIDGINTSAFLTVTIG